MQVMARKSQAACHSFFTVRRASLRLRTALHRAGVHANFLHPIQIERNAGIRQEARPASVAIEPEERSSPAISRVIPRATLG